MIVCVDGPSGVGKGTICKIIAKRLNYTYIDTGATYRCVALYCILNNIDIDDNDKVIKCISDININFDSNNNVYLNNVDVTNRIREKDVSSIVSYVSSNIKLREKLVDLQRVFASGNNVIIEGRDTTTIVFPNADVKIYLDATLLERANRRYLQNKENNIKMTYDEVLDNIKKRDYNDMNKAVGALTHTDEQIYIDSTNLSIDEVIDKIINIIGSVKK